MKRKRPARRFFTESNREQNTKGPSPCVRVSVDFFALNSRRIDERQQAIDTLQSVSLYSNEIDIRPDDQILLLVTCVEKDTDRRIVAARRIRDGEEQKTLKKLAENSRRK